MFVVVVGFMKFTSGANLLRHVYDGETMLYHNTAGDTRRRECRLLLAVHFVILAIHRSQLHSDDTHRRGSLCCPQQTMDLRKQFASRVQHRGFTRCSSQKAEPSVNRSLYVTDQRYAQNDCFKIQYSLESEKM